MNKYIVTERVAVIAHGVLHLTEEQAKHRNLKKLGKGRYEVLGSVQFKRGEEFGYEGDLPKSMADNLTTKDTAEAAARKVAAEAEKVAAKAAKEAEKARAKLDAEAEAEWKANAALREQHGNDFDAYMAAVLEQFG